MAKVKTYTPEEVKELSVVARMPRGTWKPKLSIIAAKYGRTYGSAFAKTSDMAKAIDNPGVKGIKSSDGRPLVKLKGFKKNGEPRKSYKFRKNHSSPLAFKELAVSRDAIRFNVKAMRFEVNELNELQFIISI